MGITYEDIACDNTYCMYCINFSCTCKLDNITPQYIYDRDESCAKFESILK